MRNTDLLLPIWVAVVAFGLTICVTPIQGAEENPVASVSTSESTATGDRLLAEYFELETQALQASCLQRLTSASDWEAQRDRFRGELFDMLGLNPLPTRSDLKPVVTGTLEMDEFLVENIHFQSLPGLYVTANLYRPKTIDQPLPGVLYVCGHGKVAKDGVSFGNKTYYQHHGAWLARNGYVCLVIDTLQLGEIEGRHHGTYSFNDWWWINAGYTPAGVEAWNSIRALDYLQSRTEVDANKLGVTGRSGGGAYSWWTAALDDRVRCAIPVAGITDLQNYVIDGCVEGHCDCMFMVNTYRWDYPQVAALVSPRPLLLSNTDTDNIFPLDGVVRTFNKVRHVYRLQNAEPLLGLNITAGAHVDTQELQIHALRWLDTHLKGEPNRLIETAAVKYFEPEQLKVFSELPADARNTSIQENFTRTADEAQMPATAIEWTEQRNRWLSDLRDKTFRGWPSDEAIPPLNVTTDWTETRDGVVMTASSFLSQTPYRLPLYLVQQADASKIDQVVVHVLDDSGWNAFVAEHQTFHERLGEGLLAVQLSDDEGALQRSLFPTNNVAHVYFAPRCVGPTAFNLDEKAQVQNRRRFYLLGQTLEGMQVWDVRQMLQALRRLDRLQQAKVTIQATNQMAAVAMLAVLFEPSRREPHSTIDRLELRDLPTSFRDGPILMNVDLVCSMPAVVAMAAERSNMVLTTDEPDAWAYPSDVASKLGWDATSFQLVH